MIMARAPIRSFAIAGGGGGVGWVGWGGGQEMSTRRHVRTGMLSVLCVRAPTTAIMCGMVSK